MTTRNAAVDFDKLFNPESMAFIGASKTPTKWGFIIMANILRAGFRGKLFPVNPNYTSLFGMDCYPSLSAIKQDIELAVITVPAKQVPGIIDECIEKRILNTIVITSDFRETGSEGAELERIITEKAAAANMGLIGPNTMGILNAYSDLNILMPPVHTERGYVSIVSQSGNVGTQIMSECLAKGVGVSKFVSSGNEAQVTCEDYISYLAEDDNTKVIVLYIESLKEGRKFLDICRNIKAAKPIIMYKSGKTSGGMSAAASHTGAMAGSIDVYRSVFRQCGIIEAESTEEIIDLICGFVSYPVPKGNKVGIVTIGGGWGVITADECESQGLILPELPDEVCDKLDAVLPKYWSRQNPVDMVAALSVKSHLESINAVAAWDGVDAVIGLGGGTVSSYIRMFAEDGMGERLGLKKEEVDSYLKIVNQEATDYKKSLGELMKKYDKPIIHVEIGHEDTAYQNMKDYNFTVFMSPERAVRVLRKMVYYSHVREKMNK